MKSDINIQRDVEAELHWSPDIDDREIAVKVNEGIVSLTGFTGSYFEKYQAENAAKRVAGVAGVADELQVRVPADTGLDDPGIAHVAVAALKTSLAAAADGIKVLVSAGHVTLEGSVEWYFQRERAEAAVRPLKGVRILNNHIRIEPRVQPVDIKHRIEEAFRRSADIDAGSITVVAEGGRVTLGGRVHSWAERMQAQDTAWSAPGVRTVQNNISVGA